MTGRPPEARLTRMSRDLRRAVSWHRQLLAAGLAAGAVAVGLQAMAPPPSATIEVLAAARDLAGGTRLQPGDLRSLRLPPSAVPEGAVAEAAAAIGRVLAAPMRAGEPVTDIRLVGPGLLRGVSTGKVAAPVRLADAQAVRVLRPGDLVDVLAAATLDPAGTGPVAARVVVGRARVLALPRDPDAAALDGGLVVLAVDREEAVALAAAGATGRLSFSLLGG